MATTTATAKKTTASCNVSFTGNSVSIQSETGSVLTLSLGDSPGATLRGLPPHDRTFLLSLMNPDAPAEQEMSFAEMRRFKSLCETIQPVAAPTLKATHTEKGAKQAHEDIARRTSRTVGNVEERVASLQAVVSATKQSYWIVQYDIAGALKRECPNPSGVFWRYGFRWTESVWIMPESSLTASRIEKILNAWKEVGLKHYVVEISERMLGEVRAMAREALDTEIRRIHTSLIECIASADEAFVNALDQISEADSTETTTLKLAKTRDNKVRSILKKASEGLDAAISCAEAFDETEKVADLLQGLREAIRSRAASFNALTAAKGTKGSDVQV